MIVDPDFFEHWRTRMVSDMLGGDPMAPIYIMRLWAHCQNRKGEIFDIPVAGIKAICQYPGDAQSLEDALIASQYLERDGRTVTVVGWAEKNASLIASWENGHKGGRPKKHQKTTQAEPTGNPEETHGKPSDNPSATQAKPIREEKIREEIPTTHVVGAHAPKPTKRAYQLPADFYPNETGVSYAEQRRVSLAVELESFRNHHRAKGSTFKDWQAAWRTWCDKAVEFGRAGGHKPQPLSYAQQDELARRARWEEMTGRKWPTNDAPADFIDVEPMQRIV
jgi:hypothetical protein